MKGQPVWLLLCLQLLLSVHIPLAASYDLQGDLAALEALVTACSGDTLKAQDWHLDCSFPGVTCSPCSSSSTCNRRISAVHSSSWQGARVTMSFGHKGTHAAVPADSSALDFLSSMDHLVELQLSDCGLSGGIPVSVSKLSKLRVLDLSGNQLTGQLPLWLSTELPDLQSANLSHNHFIGSIPAVWCISGGSSSDVPTQYDLRGNARLRGPVPSCLLQTQQLLSDLDPTGNSSNGPTGAAGVSGVAAANTQLSANSSSISDSHSGPASLMTATTPLVSSPAQAQASVKQGATPAAAAVNLTVPATPASPAPPQTVTIVQQVQASNSGLKVLAWALPLVAVLCLLLGAAISLWLMHRHQSKLKQQERERLQEHKMLKQLMYALTDGGSHLGLPYNVAYPNAVMFPGPGPTITLPNAVTSSMAGGAIIGPLPGTANAGGPLAGLLSQPAESIRLPSMHAPGGSHTGMHGLPYSTSTRDVLQHAWASSKAFAFVVTDVEGSTQLSATAGPALCARLQEIHDNVMRELIAKYGGLEVGTEGDSFTVAFTSVAPAAAFCMEVQYKLLDTAWPAASLKLQPCKPIRGPGGQLQMAGLRVRMGIHWAGEGTVAHRLHPLTKQRVFEGPGLQTAQELGDCAHGGQVLLSHDAWLMLRGHMAFAGFPVVRCLGTYQLESMPAATWLYHITELVGKPLNRSFGPPRGIRILWNPHVPKTPSNADAPSSRSKPRYNILASISATASNNRAMRAMHTGTGGHRAGTNIATAPTTTLSQSGLQVTSAGGHGSHSYGPEPPASPSWDLRCIAPPGVATLASSPQAAGLAFVVCQIVPTSTKRSTHKLPGFMSARLEEVLAIQAQQFRGYLYDGGPTNPSSNNGTSTAATPTHTPQDTQGGHDAPGSPCAQGGDVQHTVFSVAAGGAAPVLVAAGPSRGAVSMGSASLAPVPSSNAGKSTGSCASNGWWRLAFENAIDALRFCHAAQMALMYVRCSHHDSSCQAWVWEQVLGPDGRPLFQGARFAMALHHSHEYEAVLVPGSAPSPELAIAYTGSGPSLCDALAATVHGGQVVLTDAAWEQVKATMVAHPGAVVALSLGSHVISPDWPAPQALMEVMPNLLAKRRFPSLGTHMQTQPGYHDAPSVDKPLAIVFVKVQKPAAVVRAQQLGIGSGDDASSMGDDELLRTIMAYHLAINQYTNVARQLLAAYGGYECKEPEPGKFTLAFQTLEQAIGWAAQLQHELLAVNWPPSLATMTGCAKEYDTQGGLLWSGLRLRIGMAYGYISSKKPLNTGRADYFGVLANTAARVCAMAAPGQVLIDCSDPKAQPQGLDGLPLLRERVITRLGLTWAPVVHELREMAGDTPPASSVTGSPLASASVNNSSVHAPALGPLSSSSSQQQSLHKYTGPVSFASMLQRSQPPQEAEAADVAVNTPPSPASHTTHPSTSQELLQPDLGAVQAGSGILTTEGTEQRKLSILITDSMRQRAPQTPRVVLSAGVPATGTTSAADAVEASATRLVQSAQEQRRSMPPGLPLASSSMSRHAATTRSGPPRGTIDGVGNVATTARPGAGILSPASIGTTHQSSSSAASPASQLLCTAPTGTASASSPGVSVTAPSPGATSSTSPRATGAVVVSAASYEGSESVPASPATLAAVVAASKSRSPASPYQAAMPLTPRATRAPDSGNTGPPSPCLPLPPASVRRAPAALAATSMRGSVSFTSPQRQVSQPVLSEGSHSGPIPRAPVQRSTSAGQDFSLKQGQQQHMQRHGSGGRKFNQQWEWSGSGTPTHVDLLHDFEGDNGEPVSKDGSNSTDKLMPLRVASSASRMAGGALAGSSKAWSTAAGLTSQQQTGIVSGLLAQSHEDGPELLARGPAGAHSWLEPSGDMPAGTHVRVRQPGPGQQPPTAGAASRQPPRKLAYDDVVELRPLGWFLLRGLHNPKLLYEARPVSLAGRAFPEPAGPYQPSTPLVGRRPGGGAGGAPGSALARGMWHGAPGGAMPSSRAAHVASRLLGISSIGASLRSLLSKALGSSTLPSTTPSSFLGAGGMLASQEGPGDVELGRYGSPYPPSDDPTQPRDRWSAGHSSGLLPFRGHATEPGHPTERATWHAGTKSRPQLSHHSQHAQTHHSSRQLSADSAGTSQLGTPSGSAYRMPAGALGVAARPFALPMHAATVSSMHHGGTGASTSTQFSSQTEQPSGEQSTGPSRQQLAAVYSAVGRAATRSVAGKSGLQVLARRAMAIAQPGADPAPGSTGHAGTTTESGSTPTAALTPAASSLPGGGPECIWTESNIARTSSYPEASTPAGQQLGQRPASLSQPVATGYREVLASTSSHPGSSAGWGDAAVYPGSSSSSRQGSQANLVPLLGSSALAKQPTHSVHICPEPGAASSAGAATNALMPDATGWSASWAGASGIAFSGGSTLRGAAGPGSATHPSMARANATQGAGTPPAHAPRTGFRPATTRLQQSTSGGLAALGTSHTPQEIHDRQQSMRVGSPLGLPPSTSTPSMISRIRMPGTSSTAAAVGLPTAAAEHAGGEHAPGQQAASTQHATEQPEMQQPDIAAEIVAQDLMPFASQHLDLVQISASQVVAMPHLPPLRRLPRADPQDDQPGDEAVTTPQGMSLGSASHPGSPSSSTLPPEHQPQASPGASNAHGAATGSTDSSPNSGVYGRPGTTLPTRHNYGLLAPHHSPGAGLLGHATSPAAEASGSTLFTRLFRQPAKLLTGRSSRDGAPDEASGRSAPSLNLMQRLLQRSVTSGASTSAVASTQASQSLPPRHSGDGPACELLSMQESAFATVQLNQWHHQPTDTAASPAASLVPAFQATIEHGTRPVFVHPSHASFTSESNAASSSPQVAQQLTRLQGHSEGSAGYLATLLSRSGRHSSLDSSGRQDLESTVQYPGTSTRAWLQPRASRGSMQQRLLHTLHTSGEHNAYEHQHGALDMAGTPHINRAQVGGDSFASGRTISSHASASSHQVSGQQSITVKALSTSRHASGSGNNSGTMHLGGASHPGSECAGSALGSVTVAPWNRSGRGPPSSLQHATISSMIPHSQSMHSLFGGDLTAAMATVDGVGIMPSVQDTDVSTTKALAVGAATGDRSSPGPGCAEPDQGQAEPGQARHTEQQAADELPPLQPRRSNGSQQQLHLQGTIHYDLYAQQYVQSDMSGQSQQQQQQPSYQQLVHQLPVHQEVRGGSRDRLHLFAGGELATDEVSSGLVQIGPTPSIHSQRSRYNPQGVSDSGVPAATSQQAGGQAGTTLGHQSSSLARSQREYAAEVAATYLAQRYTRKLSGWAPATVPHAGLETGIAADSGAANPVVGFGLQAQPQLYTQYHVVPGALSGGAECSQPLGTPMSLTPAGSLSAADALLMPGSVIALTTATGKPLSRTPSQQQVSSVVQLPPPTASAIVLAVSEQSPSQQDSQAALAGQLPTELTLRIDEQLELPQVTAPVECNTNQPSVDAGAAQGAAGDDHQSGASSASKQLVAASSLLGTVPAPAGPTLPSVPSRLSRVQHWLQSDLNNVPGTLDPPSSPSA